MKRVLVTGASGLLGSRIIRIGSRDYDMCGTYFTHPFSTTKARYFYLDIRQKNQVKKLIDNLNPEVVIHCAASVNADYCEEVPEEAWKTNVEGTRNVVNSAGRSKVVFISSSYVFDGNKGSSYTEEDLMHPMNYYGKTKMIGEKLVKATCDDWAIIRTSVLYGWNIFCQRLNFVTWIIDQLKQTKAVRIVTDQIGTPTHANNLATAILRIIKMNKRGIYNIVGRECIDRHSFSQKIAKAFDLNERLIVQAKSVDLGQKAKRPFNDCLAVGKAERELRLKFLNIDEGLSKMTQTSRKEEQEWFE